MTSTSTSPLADRRLNPSRLRLARERRGLSKASLATLLGVSTRVLRTYESDGAPLSRADQLADVLGVRPGFLRMSDRNAISADQGFFRARRRASAGELASARAAASIGTELYEWLERRFDLPATQVPDLDHQDPEDAANTVRAIWGRGDEPLPNLVQLSEAHGVRVVSLPTDAQTVDAFSLWTGDQPYVFLSMAKTPERSRFDLAHELGHLVMHSRVRVDKDGQRTTGSHLERDADTFASALLMPRRDVLARSGREPAAPHILRLRSHYRVSAMAVTRRLHEVGRLSDWGYRQNCVELSQRGFRSVEPGGIIRERSRVFAMVFPSLRESGLGADEVSAALGITTHELHALTLGQVPVTFDGGWLSPGRSRRPDLHLVPGSS